MGKAGKSLALALILVITISILMTVKPANTQAITIPSIPEFTSVYQDHSYDIQPTYSTDTYTGKTIVTNAGYHVQNDSIIITIKNQPFNPYSDSNGNLVQLYYNVSFKGHFGQSWDYFHGNNYFLASNSDYTLITLGIYGNNGTGPYDSTHPVVGEIGGIIDFRLQAFVAYYTTTESAPDPLFHRTYPILTWYGESSDWSSTQSVTIPESSVSPNSTSIVPEYSSSIILPLTLVTLSTVFVIKRKMRKKSND